MATIDIEELRISLARGNRFVSFVRKITSLRPGDDSEQGGEQLGPHSLRRLGDIPDQPAKDVGKTKAGNHKLQDIIPSTADMKRFQGKYVPGRILAITIGGIALAEVIAMIVVYPFSHWPFYLQVFVDAATMIVIIFPLLYFLSFRPLLLHIQQRYQADLIAQTRLRLMQHANTHTLDELLQATLDEIETLTGSSIGFLHFLEEDERTLWLQAWSTNTLKKLCTAEGKDSHYDVDQAGVWADCVRQRQPIIHNNYASLPNRKGMPEGHAPVIREITVPVLRNDKVVAILGVGNKPQEYTARDLEIVTTLADFAWDIVEHKRSENAIRKSEQKFRSLVDWTYDWEMWVDPQDHVVYVSPSCQRVTGYSPEEFMAFSSLLSSIVHPDDRQAREEHQRLIHNESAGPMNIEFRIIARDGSIHWIDHICRPLFGTDGKYLGRRVANRDITERKHIEAEFRERERKEKALTQTIQNMQMDIARDLHDTLGQNIGFLRMNLAHLTETGLNDQAAIQTRVHKMTRAVNESYDLIRGMLAVLQPGNLSDPLNIFTRYAEQVAERSSFHIELTSQGNPNHLSPHQMLHLYHIFREALSNIEKYAEASRVTVEFIWQETGLILVISDDGSGFDPDQVQSGDHYGLKFMRQRTNLINGSLSIQSAPGMGTKITINLPY